MSARKKVEGVAQLSLDSFLEQERARLRHEQGRSTSAIERGHRDIRQAQ